MDCKIKNKNFILMRGPHLEAAFDVLGPIFRVTLLVLWRLHIRLSWWQFIPSLIIYTWRSVCRDLCYNICNINYKYLNIPKVPHIGTNCDVVLVGSVVKLHRWYAWNYPDSCENLRCNLLLFDFLRNEWILLAQ